MKNGMATPNLTGSGREAAPMGRASPRRASLRRASLRTRLSALACAGSVLLLTANLASAAALNKDQAKRMYDRIAGVTASDATLTSMVGMDATQAALNIVTKDPAFYNNTIRNLAMPWTNRDQTVFAPLNDYVATVVGMVRDDVPFNTLLSADLVYIADAASGVPSYSPSNNAMYDAMDTKSVDLKAHLVSSTQSAITGVPAAATAGVLTTRAAAAAFFINGTNRAMFRFTMMNHLCSDLQTIMDTTRPPDRIRQDVTRSPGGDSSLFLNNCIGCHSGMDPMAQAFAYYNFSNIDPTTIDTTGQIVYTAGQVQPKYFINNNNFPFGYVTPDDHWDNRWRSGVNSLLGWDPTQTGSGQGAKSLGQELGGSQAFASCQVTRVFKYVCFRAPSNAADRTQVATMIASFKSSNYSLRQVFADAAVYCMGN
jgi:hypothetical protein